MRCNSENTHNNHYDGRRTGISHTVTGAEPIISGRAELLARHEDDRSGAFGGTDDPWAADGGSAGE